MDEKEKRNKPSSERLSLKKNPKAETKEDSSLASSTAKAPVPQSHLSLTPETTKDASTRIPTPTTSSPDSPSPEAAPPSSSQPTTHPHPAITQLQSQIASLESQISTLTHTLHATTAQLTSPHGADATVKHHIALLHEYNAIKDVGLGLMGLIADARGVRLGDVCVEFGVGERS